MLSFLGLGMNDHPFLSTSFCVCVSICFDNNMTSSINACNFIFNIGIIIAYRKRVWKWILHTQIMVWLVSILSVCSSFLYRLCGGHVHGPIFLTQPSPLAGPFDGIPAPLWGTSPFFARVCLLSNDLSLFMYRMKCKLMNFITNHDKLKTKDPFEVRKPYPITLKD